MGGRARPKSCDHGSAAKKIRATKSHSKRACPPRIPTSLYGKNTSRCRRDRGSFPRLSARPGGPIETPVEHAFAFSSTRGVAHRGNLFGRLVWRLHENESLFSFKGRGLYGIQCRHRLRRLRSGKDFISPRRDPRHRHQRSDHRRLSPFPVRFGSGFSLNRILIQTFKGKSLFGNPFY